MSITHACDSACQKTIPLTCQKQGNGRIAGWSEHVNPLKEKSLFWHRIWDSCGRPRSGHVADCMRQIRAAIRKVKRKAEQLQREQFAQSVLTNSSRNF